MVKRFLIVCSLLQFILPSFGQDLRLWYKEPASKWTDALPIGNGRLGAMIFGGVVEDRIQFNEETLWTGRPREYNKMDAHKYLPQIRQLLEKGKQKEAEKQASEHFMGLKSSEGDRVEWVNAMRSLKGLFGNPAAVNYNDQEWKDMTVPSYEGWEAIGFEGLDGAVWFRTTFELPAAWKGEDLVLDLNRIRDMDFTYVNGKLVGQTEGTDARKYTIPKEVLVAGINSIAIQVLNFVDKGGIAGYKDTTRHIGIYPEGKAAAKISLVKAWKYKIQNDSPPAVARYQADYQPFGELRLQFVHGTRPQAYKRELDLATAVVRTSYEMDGVQFKREYLASQPHQAVVIHLSANKQG
ncbi:MAG TPA: glycoside hydrolase N-terminal domain-containing protein, partial [Flavisolibacter sp.]